MSIRFLNKNNGNSVAEKPNVFMQEDEPAKKEGIWLQSNKTFDIIVADTDMQANEEVDMSKNELLPYPIAKGSAIAIGSNIYLFGGINEENYNTAYKYNTLDNTFIQLESIPFSVNGGCGITTIGTDIYLFGGSIENVTKTAYKYDTINGVYTQLADIPESFNGKAFAIGTDIYLIKNAGNGSSYSCIYKYNSLTNEYTLLTSQLDALYRMSNFAATAIGTDIYVFGSSIFTSNNDPSCKAYKYDTITNTFTSLKDVPYSSRYGEAVAIDSNIYLIGGGNNNYSSTNFYKYNIVTNTYTKLTDLPESFGYCPAISMNEEKQIYLLGRYDFGIIGKTIRVINLKIKDYPDNTIVISQGIGEYKTKLLPSDIENLMFYFHNVWHYTKENGLDKTIPTYYGDGTQWIKFKN